MNALEGDNHTISTGSQTSDQDEVYVKNWRAECKTMLSDDLKVIP